VRIEELNRSLNPTDLPYLEASAARGAGVVESLARISKLVVQRVKQSLGMLAPGWDEDPVVRFVRSKISGQDLNGDYENYGGPAARDIEQKASRYRDVFGRSWM